MKYLKVERKNANEAKKLILRLNLFDGSRKAQHSRSYVYFPIDIRHAKAKKPFDKINATIVEKKEQESAKTETYEARLNRILGKKERELLSKGYDQLGNIAIIEFRGSRSSEKRIANALMQSNKSIKTVLAKAGAVSGKFRIRKIRYIAGQRTYIANYRENNCIFRFDTRKVFFSNRLSFERSRVLKLVKDGENVMVMFAGVGPFAIEIAKAKPNSKIVAIEANKFGFRSMLGNIRLNKVNNVKAVLGDVRKKSNNFREFADRIIMPLPWSSLDYLDDAVAIARKNATVHIYAFAGSKSAYDEVYNRIKEHSKMKNYRVRLLNKREVRPYSKSEMEIVLDYKIEK